MLSDASNPKQYLEQLPEDWRRRTLLELGSIIHETASDLTESMSYGMLGYGAGDSFAFHLNAQRNYVSLYVGNASDIDPSGELLKGLNVGKGCVRFTKSKSPGDTRISEFIARAHEHWKTSGQTGC
ncbi:MAG: DUF1801 domain-containing protein [Pseudomonadota bacterium]